MLTNKNFASTYAKVILSQRANKLLQMCYERTFIWLILVWSLLVLKEKMATIYQPPSDVKTLEQKIALRTFSQKQIRPCSSEVTT